ncbi:MAG: zinc-dependent metalloprotease [Rikenellaceae bacterium]
MKINIMAKSLLIRQLLILTLLLSICVQASAKRSKKDDDKPSEPTKYEKLFKDKSVVSSTGGMMDLHIIDGKLHLELPFDLLGRPMMLATMASQTGEPSMVPLGVHTTTPLYLTFEQRDSTILVNQIPSRYITESDDERSRAIGRNFYGATTLYSYPIKAYNSDSTALVIETTDLFKCDREDMSPAWRGSGMLSVKSRKDSAISQIKAVSSRADNIVVNADLQFNVMVSFIIFPMSQGVARVDLAHTLMLLPEEKMAVLVADRRVAAATINREVIPEDGSAVTTESILCRWSIEPEDFDAWSAGELTKPKEPLALYLDPEFPEGWAQPISEGVLAWNKTFEAIGLKDVIQVVDFPQDDPDFDPASYRYSCIRYAISKNPLDCATINTDPLTGEIISANLVINNHHVNDIYNNQFIQTAAVDASVRTVEPTLENLQASLRNLAMREMGRILGLEYNYAASAAFATDSLRSRAFVAEHGLSPSVMDPVTFNYVAQAGDDMGVMQLSKIGPYDYMNIDWLYRPMPASFTKAERTEELKRRIAQSIASQEYRVASRRGAKVYEPSAVAVDLGDDAIKSSTYGVANLSYTIENMSQWLDSSQDPTGERKRLLMLTANKAFAFYLTNVMRNIGGINLVDKVGGDMQSHAIECVSAQLQRESVIWSIDMMRSCAWLANTEIYSKIALSFPSSYNLPSTYITNVLLGYASNVALCSSLSDDPYSVSDFFDDIFSEVFRPTVENKPLRVNDKTMQEALISAAQTAVKDKADKRVLQSSPLFGLTQSTGQEIAALSTEEAAEFAKFVEIIDNATVIDSAIKMPMAISAQQQYIDQLLKILPVVSQRAKSGVVADRVYYQALMISIEKTLQLN